MNRATGGVFLGCRRSVVTGEGAKKTFCGAVHKLRPDIPLFSGTFDSSSPPVTQSGSYLCRASRFALMSLDKITLQFFEFFFLKPSVGYNRYLGFVHEVCHALH